VDCLEASIVRERSARHRATGNIRAMFKNLVFAAILGYFEKRRKTFNRSSCPALPDIDGHPARVSGRMN
jgi:hypothetical protein